MKMQLEVQGGVAEFQPGLKVRISGRLAGKELSHAALVTGYEWGRVLEWSFQDAYGVRGMQRWELAPTSGGTRLDMRDEYELPGSLGHMADWLLTRHAVARRNMRDLQRLKKLAER